MYQSRFNDISLRVEDVYPGAGDMYLPYSNNILVFLTVGDMSLKWNEICTYHVPTTHLPECPVVVLCA